MMSSFLEYAITLHFEHFTILEKNKSRKENIILGYFKFIQAKYYSKVETITDKIIQYDQVDLRII